MSVETCLHRLLATHAGLAALVGDRVYPVELPPDPTLPAVTFQLVSDVRANSHDGPSGLGRARYQFDCWAGSTPHGLDHDAARAVAKQVRLALHKAEYSHDGDAVRGFLPGGTDRDMPDPLAKRARRIVDFTFWHTEEIP